MYFLIHTDFDLLFIFSDYIRWTDNSNSENHTTDTSQQASLGHQVSRGNRVSLNQNLSTPVIPQDGLYMIYAQITWTGKKDLQPSEWVSLLYI